jgi:hypothetical protein
MHRAEFHRIPYWMSGNVARFSPVLKQLLTHPFANQL